MCYSTSLANSARIPNRAHCDGRALLRALVNDDGEGVFLPRVFEVARVKLPVLPRILTMRSRLLEVF